MNETAFAPTVFRPDALSRMRGATRHACARAVELMNAGATEADALREAGISRRSLDRYVKAVGHAAPEAARPLGGSQSTPAPLPLFDVHDRIAAIERRLDAYDALIGSIDRRTVRAAEILNDAAHELADWPKT